MDYANLALMFPVLFTIGSFPVSSFGLFVVLSIIFASFIIWRIIQVYDFDKELVFDLVFLTSIGGLIGARIYHILFNLNQFNDPTKIFFITKYPGLSFWGAFIGGLMVLRLLCLRYKIPFFQIADYGMVGFFAALFLGHIGCLMGSCEYGMVTDLPIGVQQVGLIGKRFPLQIIESLLSLLVLGYLWKKVLKFHFSGQIFSLGLILLGISKFILEFFRGDKFFVQGILLGQIWSVLLILSGVWVYYIQGKRSILKDMKLFFSIFTNPQRRQLVVSKIKKNCYNLNIKWRLNFQRAHKKFAKVINIKSNPNEFNK